MLTPLYASWLSCLAIYNQKSAFDRILTVGCDVIGIKQVGDVLTITPEGTVDAEMWHSNFDALPTYYPALGNMHSGFLESALAIYKAVKPLITGPVSFQGHSRGAALASIMASLCALDGIKVTQLFLFEAPNHAYQRYADFCAEQVVNGMIGFELSTVNDIDPVPDLPIEPYVRSYPITELNQLPGGLEDINMVDYHLGETIYAGMQKRYSMPA